MIATNPCGEQPLLPNESCNLGSINLSKFVIDGQIDWDRMEKTTRLAVNFLDNVIDANYYATPEIEEMTKATRKIGVGVMGFADLLIQLEIPYNTEQARKLGQEVIEFVRTIADDASIELAAKRGAFPAFEKSTFNKVTEVYRNACRMTVAPTGTISMIAGCSSGIEPHFALALEKQNILEGKTLVYINEAFEKAAKEGKFYSDGLMRYLTNGGSLQEREDVPDRIKEIFITAPEVSPEEHVLMQAAFQPNIDSGISKTINMAHDATVQDVWDAYMLAWEEDCKGITVYREGSRDKEVLVKGTQSVDEFQCCENPSIIYQDGCHKCQRCDWSACEIA